VAGFCEHRNEPSGSIKVNEVPVYLCDAFFSWTSYVASIARCVQPELLATGSSSLLSVRSAGYALFGDVTPGVGVTHLVLSVLAHEPELTTAIQC
jgi:hypothetical protein